MRNVMDKSITNNHIGTNQRPHIWSQCKTWTNFTSKIANSNFYKYITWFSSAASLDMNKLWTSFVLINSFTTFTFRSSSLQLSQWRSLLRHAPLPLCLQVRSQCVADLSKVIARSGWAGLLCDTPTCDPPCGHGGVCVRPDVCACQPGYTGGWSLSWVS